MIGRLSSMENSSLTKPSPLTNPSPNKTIIKTRKKKVLNESQKNNSASEKKNYFYAIKGKYILIY